MQLKSNTVPPDPALPRPGGRVLVGPVRFDELCAHAYRRMLAAGLDVVLNPGIEPLTPAQVTELGATADAAIVGMEDWPADVIDRCPNLKIISKLGVGIDTIDAAHARRRGIDVTNAPGGNANAVAELAVGLILAASRHVTLMDRRLRAGVWDRFTGHELTGKTVGFVGFGTIARMLARRLSGFDIRAVFTDPLVAEDIADPQATRLDIDDLLATSDIVTVHAPHNPGTHHMIDAEFLSKMKPGSIFVNTSRGGLVRESDLLAALRSGHLGAAALDVWEIEPLPASSELLALDNVVATPHGAADSFEAYERVADIVSADILTRLAGNTPRHVQN